MNNSNQPDFSHLPHTMDRDWHVIVEDQGLAQTFAYYLNYDYVSAAAHQAPNPGLIEKAIEDAEEKKARNENPPPATPAAPPTNPVAAQTFDNVDVTVTPLPTPDLLPSGQPQYLTNIVNLIQGAQKSIYIQLQYIESSTGAGSDYEKLLQAVADKVSQGKDVRLIESRQYGLKWVEKMKSEGVDLTDNIWLQYDVHNKGFVIDSKIAVVSSQNFSPAGVEENRDAGLIIENEDIAKYFQKVFLSDLNTRTISATASPATKAAKSGAKGKSTARTRAAAAKVRAARKGEKKP